jgi:choline monooxygenase
MSVHGFDPAPEAAAAWTPPCSWYTDPEFHALERRAVFRQNWLFAARAEQLARPGAFVAAAMAGETWIALRHADGRLRAMHNVCRHHAAEICRGAGEAAELVCPYHGWTYDLDGRLRSAPELGAARGFERSSFALPPLAVEELDRFVFVHCDPRAAPLAPRLAELTRRLDAFGGQGGELVFVERAAYELDCNWKVFVDNYLDGGYHIAHLHHGLAGELELSDYRTEVFERFSIQSCRGAQADERVGGGALYAFVHPNFMINRYGAWLDTNLVLPLGERRTRVVMDYWVEAQLARDPAFLRESLAASRRVHDEDVGISESVQRGLSSSSYESGRYAAREVAMHAFHRDLAADLARAGEPPALARSAASSAPASSAPASSPAAPAASQR